MNQNSSFKILIVDDQAVDISALNHLGRNVGFDMTLAFDGDQAWDLVQKQPFDLIILDWQMPTMPGWIFLKHLEQFLNQKNAPSFLCRNIVIHSAAELSFEDFKYDSPFEILDIWQKPLSAPELVKRLNKVCYKIGA